MRVKSAILFCSTAIVVLFGFFAASAQTQTQAKVVDKPTTSSQSQKEEIEQIVREYLLKNPAVIREALISLQTQEENERKQRNAEKLRTLKPEIYDDADSPVAGNRNGDVSVVVFYDYYCGYCRKTLPELQKLVAEDNSIRIIYKEFPILGANSELMARAALAANRQGKFAEFHKAALESQGVGEAFFKSLAGRAGLNYERLQKDMNDPKINQIIQRNISLAQAIGVDGTPAYLIGEQFIPGAVSLTSLTQIVVAERAKHAQTDSSKKAQKPQVN